MTEQATTDFEALVEAAGEAGILGTVHVEMARATGAISPLDLYRYAGSLHRASRLPDGRVRLTAVLGGGELVLDDAEWLSACMRGRVGKV